MFFRARHKKFCLVTAADQTHAKSLFQFLDSVQRRAPQTDIIVYNLGLSHLDLEHLKKLQAEHRHFDFSKYQATSTSGTTLDNMHGSPRS